jgi:hypothetical protein
MFTVERMSNILLTDAKGVALEMVQNSSVAMLNPIEPILTALHYLFSHEDKKIVAHCLELDIATHGNTIKAAEDSLNFLVLHQIEVCFICGNYAQLKFKAPFEYWQALEGARDMGTVHLEVEVPPVVLPVTKKVALPVMRVERVAA